VLTERLATSSNSGILVLGQYTGQHDISTCILELAMSGRTVDVVVVGAGAVGASCAFYLAAAGLKVLVLEQDQVASGASTCATGAINVINGDFGDEAFLRWGVLGHEVTKEIVPIIEDLSGFKTQHQCRPGLRLAMDDNEEAQVREDFSWQSKVVPATWLEPDEVRAIEPRINPTVRGAVLEPEASQVPGPRLTHAFVRAAERLGAVLMPTAVTGLQWTGDRVTAVQHRHGVVYCDVVILAMGATAYAASTWIDYVVPVWPLRGERLMLRFPERPLQVLLTTPKRGHIISRLDGFLSVGSTGGRDFDDRSNWVVSQEEAALTPHPEPSAEARAELLERSSEVIAAIRRASVAEHIAGIRPYSPDSKPIIGPVPGRSGVYLATGHTHRGIHLAAVTGQLIRDHVLHGHFRQTDCDPSIFDPARFAQNARMPNGKA
jgi:glycine/D-amino acid oxidase-like deaminating enzyme